MATLKAYGISLELPENWEGTISRKQVDPSEASLPVLHASNTQLPPGMSTYGMELVSEMGGSGIFVCLTEQATAAPGIGLFDAEQPKELPLDSFSSTCMPRVTENRLGVQHFFSSHERDFGLFVVIGRSVSQSDSLTADLDGVISSLVIQPLTEQARR